jgi:hypothetical protein
MEPPACDFHQGLLAQKRQRNDRLQHRRPHHAEASISRKSDVVNRKGLKLE